MKSISYLPILDISDIKTFNRLLVYNKKRDFESLTRNSLIKELDSKIKHRVIYSMLIPQKESLEIYNEILDGPSPQKIIDYLILLYKKILGEHKPEKINLIAILRSGLPLALLLRYIIYKIHGIKVKVSAISPNYIDQIDIDSFKNYIGNFNNNIESIFVDSWCSEGVTYNIVKNFWIKLFPDKKFYYTVLSNLSSFEKEDLIYAVKKDFLIPWSICQTDNLGIGNYFLHPIDRKCCTFIIPENKRKIKNSEIIYRKIIDQRVKDKLDINELYQEDRTSRYPTRKQINISIIKLGINECIKSIDKKDNIELYINNASENPDNKILERYAKINSIKYQNTSKELSFVVRNFSQK